MRARTLDGWKCFVMFARKRPSFACTTAIVGIACITAISHHHAQFKSTSCASRPTSCKSASPPLRAAPSFSHDRLSLAQAHVARDGAASSCDDELAPASLALPRQIGAIIIVVATAILSILRLFAPRALSLATGEHFVGRIDVQIHRR